MTSLKRWRKPMETSWKKHKSGCYSEGHVFFLKASVGCFFSSRNQIAPTLNSEMLWQSMHQITLKFIEFTAKSATFPDNEDTIWRLTAGLCLLFCNKFDRLCCNESRCLGIEGFCDNTPSLAEWKEFSWTNFLVPSYIGQHPQVQESSFWFEAPTEKHNNSQKNPTNLHPKKNPAKPAGLMRGSSGMTFTKTPRVGVTVSTEELGHRFMTSPAAEFWPGAEAVFEVREVFLKQRRKGSGIPGWKKTSRKRDIFPTRFFGWLGGGWWFTQAFFVGNGWKSPLNHPF